MGEVYHKNLTGADLHNPKIHAFRHEIGGNDTLSASLIEFSASGITATNIEGAILELHDDLASNYVNSTLSIVDNRLVKGDGDFKGIQETGITIDDSDNVSGMGTLGCGAITTTGDVTLGADAVANRALMIYSDAAGDNLQLFTTGGSSTGMRSYDVPLYLATVDDQDIRFSINGGLKWEFSGSGDGYALFPNAAYNVGSTTKPINNIIMTSDIGIAGDTDLLQLAANALTVNGTIGCGAITSTDAIEGTSITDGTGTLSSGALSGITTLTMSGDFTATTNTQMSVTHTDNADAFTFTQATGTTGNIKVFTIDDQDAGGSGQDKSSVLKVLKSGAISTSSTQQTLLELVYTGGTAQPAAETFYALGYLTADGNPDWGIDLADGTFWTEGSVNVGCTGAYSDTNPSFTSPQITLNSGGDITLTGELKGSRTSYVLSYDAEVGGSTMYMKAGEVIMDANKGLVMPRAGSIVGISVMYDVTGWAKTINIQAMKNGTSVWSNALSATGVGNQQTDYFTQARGSDAFSAGDDLQVRIYQATPGPFTLIDDIIVTLEVQFDT